MAAGADHVPAEQSRDAHLTSGAARGSLLRVLGVGFGLAVIVGDTIAAGILRTPGEIAGWLPNGWLFIGVWILGGLYALLGAFAISELSAMIPRSGGYYIYARRAFGEFPAFVMGWTDFLAQTGSIAAVAIVIAEYSADLAPAFRGKTVALALVVTVAMAVLQWQGIRWGSAVQNLTAAAKALVFLALVAAIFFWPHGSAATVVPAATPFAGAGAFFATAVAALGAVIYTYDGWYAVMYFGEEVRDPGRDIPRSMIGGVLAVMAIYVLVNAAILYVLPLSRIAGQDLALGKAAAALFGRSGDVGLRLLVILSMLSGINAYHLMASRIPFAMARDGLLPRRFTRVNQGGTPNISLALSVVVASIFILSGRVFLRVSAILAFFFVADYFMAYLGVFVLRRREPRAPRPYRAWGYPWTTAIALLGSLAFLIAAIFADRANSLWALATLGLSWPLYLGARAAKSPG